MEASVSGIGVIREFEVASGATKWKKKFHPIVIEIMEKISPLRGHILIARSSQVWAHLGRMIRSLRFAQSYILRIDLSLFLVIWYWSKSQVYNIVDVNYIFSKLLNLFSISNEKGNSIYLRLYQLDFLYTYISVTF